jgi:hypothetical protein
MTLTGPLASQVWRKAVNVPAGHAIRIWETSTTPIATDHVDVHVLSTNGKPVTLRVTALRVMGQSDRLRKHLDREGLGG